VEQGSKAYVSDATIQNSGGPGILGLAHATLDVEGSTFSSNAAGAIVCDDSASLQTDLAPAVLGQANRCMISSNPGENVHNASSDLNLSLPDWQSIKARSIKLNRMISSHHTNVSPLVK
jgi:hypothetical protein